MEDFIGEKLKKSMVTKGFLSSRDNPSQNAVVMYTIYLTNLPPNWRHEVVHIPSVGKVREFFGIDYGFENMIRWGLQFDCSHSKTSSGRHISMNKAYLMAKSNLSMGMFISHKKLKEFV
jgi:hypothetical protein